LQLVDAGCLIACHRWGSQIMGLASTFFHNLRVSLKQRMLGAKVTTYNSATVQTYGENTMVFKLSRKSIRIGTSHVMTLPADWC